MALRNQPYIPLYVQDFMTDEKLNECSAQSVGVYIKIMCIMHKSDEYGTILLKQKDKQNSSTSLNFAYKLLKHLPFSIEVIHDSILELVNEGVLIIDGDKMFQKRMVKDNKISEARSRAGSEGGKKSAFAQAKLQANTQAKHQANSEYEYENNIVVNKEEKTDSLFEGFWEEYHNRTTKPKEDKEAAFKKWKQLTKEEKRKAIDMIEAYSRSNDPRYLKKARTYLGDKSFNNEFSIVDRPTRMVY